MVEKVTIGDATLYHGDCLEILPGLGEIDAVVTDPPYGIDNWSDSGGGQKSISAEEAKDMKRWDKVPTEQIQMAWNAADAAIFWGGNYLADLLGKCKAPLIWDKLTRGMHLSEAEIAWTKGCNGTCRVFTKVSNLKYRKHPTQKPVRVMEWAISLTPGTSVLDPFMGSGSTGVACANMGRQFVGIELERKYFDVACERIEHAYSQPRLFNDVEDACEQESFPIG